MTAYEKGVEAASREFILRVQAGPRESDRPIGRHEAKMVATAFLAEQPRMWWCAGCSAYVPDTDRTNMFLHSFHGLEETKARIVVEP